MTQCNAYYRFFSNLANKTRFNIVMALNTQDALSVTEIAQKIGEEQSNVSHQLKSLMNCNIITVEQDGKRRLYSLNKETILPILDIITKHVKQHCKGCCPKDKC